MKTSKNLKIALVLTICWATVTILIGKEILAEYNHKQTQTIKSETPQLDKVHATLLKKNIIQVVCE